MVKTKQNLEPLALRSQLESLMRIYGEMALVVADIDAAIVNLPEETASDFVRIRNAAAKLESLLEALKTKRPKPKEDVVGFWSKQRHDLRTPINGIKNYCEMVVEDLEGDTKAAELFTSLIVLSEKTLPIITDIGKEFDEAFQQKSAQALGADEEEDWYIPGGGTILIIDDNPDNREILRRRLQAASLEVLQAEDGYEGFRMVKDHKVDVILLDIMMPGIDGYEVLKRLKQNAKYAHIPVLMISSVSELNSIVSCIQNGADDYLPTPFNPVLLKARITSCLAKKKHADRERAFTKELETAQKQLGAAIESIDEGFAIFDEEDKLVRHNQPFRSFYPEIFEFGKKGNISYEYFLQENMANGTFSPDRRRGQTPEEWLQFRLNWHLAPVTSLVERLIPRNLWIEMFEYKTPDGGTVVIHKDITARKEAETKLEHLALHDVLTGLYNRAYFDQKLEDQIEKSKRSNSVFSVLFFDLDGFKNINDTLGHEFGDVLLVTVSDCLRKSVRANDTVARLGGDEFSIILDLGSKSDEAVFVAERALKNVGTFVEYNGQQAKFGTSIGIATYPQDGLTREDLMKAADKAMYAAKNAGKGQYRIYNDIKLLA